MFRSDAPESHATVSTIIAVAFDEAVLKSIKVSYKDDKLLGPVSANPERYPPYTFDDGLIDFESRLCVSTSDRKS
jgi:hypothetical protein